MPDADVAIFLKGAGNTLSYVIITRDNEVKPIQKMLDLFGEFSDDMRMMACGNLVFIPAGTKGILIFEYSNSSFTRIKTLNNVKDARDLTLKRLHTDSELLIIAADYQEGLAAFTMNLQSKDIGVTNVTKEFVKAKSISMVPRGENDTLLLIVDALGGSSKYVVLSLDVKFMEMSYDQIRLLDGVVHYGDITEEYASIIMDNSVMVLKILQEEDSMVGYINSHGVNNAKLLKLDDETSWLIHSRSNEILITDFIANSGFLICRLGAEARPYNFTVLGQSKNCRLENGMTLLNCYYSAQVVLNVVDKESLNSLIHIVIVMSVSILVAVVIIVLVMIFYYFKYKRTQEEIDKEKEKLRLSRTSQVTSYPEAVSYTHLTLPTICSV
eukprot:TRINITY_DN7066_c0_g1_i11.p1 TRINITY_DN7066_c0_g1~~TRINITY_DN7066_c0_g1_i11.p1  ORF type:complete len:383 (+),score=59.65 TRINITY_DN7066_c0_g1_i11:1-1149(+)